MSDLLPKLEAIIVRHAPMVVAYSGGVDSACLLAVAHRLLGDRVLGVIADSPSLPRKALADALLVASGFGARVEVIPTLELENEEYASNPINRCYFCKAELFVQLDEIARQRGFRSIAYGENSDDPAALRPGSRAAAEFSVLAPLKEAGLTKADVRQISRDLGLPTAERPAQPCLSSRIPHGTRVTRTALDYVERGEEFVRSLGFQVLRVRYIDGSPPHARVLVDPSEVPRLLANADHIIGGLRAIGFDRVDLDPDGYRAANV